LSQKLKISALEGEQRLVKQQLHEKKEEIDMLKLKVKMLKTNKPSDGNEDIAELKLRIVQLESKLAVFSSKKIPKQLKTKIWITAYGETIKAKCYCCGIKDIDITHFEAGHIFAKANGGEISEANLRPICSGCNKGMGTNNMSDYATLVYPETSLILKNDSTSD